MLGLWDNIPPVDSELHLKFKYDRLAAVRHVQTRQGRGTSEGIKQSLFESQRQIRKNIQSFLCMYVRQGFTLRNCLV